MFVEPIIFNKHISVLYFKYENNKRINLLFDPSLYHFNILIKDKTIFSKTMRARLLIFPKYSCQTGPSCSIWFMGQILFSFNYGNILFNDNDEFEYINLIRMINYINILINIDETPIIYSTRENIQTKSINISDDERCIISHKIVFASFLNIFGIMHDLGVNGTLFDYSINDIKYKFDKIRQFISSSLFSKDYYNYLGEQSDITDTKINKLKEDYLKLQRDYDNFINSILNAKNDVDLKFQLEKKMLSLLDKTLEDFQTNFTCNIYEKEQIRNIYLEKNDMFSSLTN